MGKWWIKNNELLTMGLSAGRVTFACSSGNFLYFPYSHAISPPFEINCFNFLTGFWFKNANYFFDFFMHLNRAYFYTNTVF
jgi:hypothetical protein